MQFTAPYRDEHVPNRQLGTVQQIDGEGNLQVRLDSGQGVQFNIREHPHIDYGYAVTSRSRQGATADRVLVHVDTEHAREELINSRLAYVSVSRDRYDAQIYTNDAEKLGEELSLDVSKEAALQAACEMGAVAKATRMRTARTNLQASHMDRKWFLRKWFLTCISETIS